MTVPLISRLDARDRMLYLRAALDRDAARSARLAWIGITHLGSAAATIGAAVAPLVLPGAIRQAGWLPGLALLVSHLAIQIVKRLVSRERPTVRCTREAWIPCPDPFSFPSGHATSALAVALAFGTVSRGRRARSWWSPCWSAGAAWSSACTTRATCSPGS